MNTRLSQLIAISLLLFVAGLSVVLWWYFPTLNWIYKDKLQTPLFTGFLTLGSFLLTLKIFIVVQLKEKLYDSTAYQDEFAKHRLQNSKLRLYDPLSRLAELLLVAVIASLGTALTQITIGFVGMELTSAICLSAAIGTLLLVVFVWWQIRRNIYDLFEYATKDQDATIKKKTDDLRNLPPNVD